MLYISNLGRFWKANVLGESVSQSHFAPRKREHYVDSWKQDAKCAVCPEAKMMKRFVATF